MSGVEKIYKGRKEIMIGLSELCGLSLMPDSMSDMIIMVEADFDNESTMRVSTAGNIQLKVNGMVITGGPEPEPCDEFGCQCRNHIENQ